MLQALYTSNGKYKVFKWKLRDDKPAPHIIHGTLEVVVNGRELFYIRKAINLPVDVGHNSNITNVRWFGDHAKFILANLRE